MFVHDEQEIILFGSGDPETSRLTIELSLDNILFQRKADFQKAFHHFKSEWLIHFLSSSITHEYRTKLSRF